jgi:hypothetical protein
MLFYRNQGNDTFTFFPEEGIEPIVVNHRKDAYPCFGAQTIDRFGIEEVANDLSTGYDNNDVGFPIHFL